MPQNDLEQQRALLGQAKSLLTSLAQLSGLEAAAIARANEEAANLVVNFDAAGRAANANVEAIARANPEAARLTNNIGAAHRATNLNAVAMTRVNIQASRYATTMAAAALATNAAAKAAAGLSGEMGKAEQASAKAAKGVQNNWERAAATIQRAAFVAIGAVLATSAAADPGAVRIFTFEVQNLAAAFGTILMPILNAATAIIVRLNAWITNLSPAAKAVIVAIIAMTIVLGLLVFAINKVNAALVVFNGLTGGILLIIGLIVSLIVGIAASSNAAGGSLGRLGGIAQRIGKFFELVFSKLVVIFEAIVFMVGEWWKLMEGMYGWLIQGAMDAIVHTFTTIADAITYATVALAVFYKRLREGTLFSPGWLKEIKDKVQELQKAASSTRTTQAAQGRSGQLEVGEIFFKNFAAALGQGYAAATADNTAATAANTNRTNTILSSIMGWLFTGPLTQIVSGFTSGPSSSPLSLSWGIQNPWASSSNGS